jgi:hypothetical protein
MSGFVEYDRYFVKDVNSEGYIRPSRFFDPAALRSGFEVRRAENPPVQWIARPGATEMLSQAYENDDDVPTPVD